MCACVDGAKDRNGNGGLDTGGDNVVKQFMDYAKMSPMERMREQILKSMGLTEDDLKMIDQDIKARVVAAAEFATESPEPGVKELYTDIYA